MKSNIGLIDLSVMGVNLALNMADNGYKVSICLDHFGDGCADVESLFLWFDVHAHK